jgi:hypothetical protein
MFFFRYFVTFCVTHSSCAGYMGTTLVTAVTSVTTKKSPQTRIKPRILKIIENFLVQSGEMWEILLVAASGTKFQPNPPKKYETDTQPNCSR